MIDPFDRAGYTSKMLRDLHQQRKQGGESVFGLNHVVDLNNAGIGNISNRLFLPADRGGFRLYTG